jgi:menaquinone-dependent protoporphyrinogen oxidase
VSNVLVLYASTHGHTERIAMRIGETLRADAHEVRVVNVEKTARVDAATFDVIVVGASVHAGHHQPEMSRWLREHAATLSAVPVAFFSVSLTAADDSDEARQATESYIDEFLEDTGLRPSLAVPIAGALQYREYNLPTRVLIRLIAKHKGLDTDTSIDTVYSDWDAVDRFAHGAGALAGARTAATT